MKYSNVNGIHWRSLFSLNSPNSNLTKAILFLLLIFSASFLSAQCVFPSPIPTCTNTAVFDSAANQADVTNLVCDGTATSTINVAAGGLYRITIADGNSYSFSLVPSGNNLATPFPGIMDLFHDAAQANLAATSGTVSATGGLTPTLLSYLDNPAEDNVLYLAVWDKGCAGNWLEYELTITCTTCAISTVARQHIAANESGCVSAASTFTAPVISGPCDASSLTISNQGGTGATLANGVVTLLPGLAADIYTIEFSVDNCSGMALTSTVEVVVEPSSSCHAGNVSLSSNCTTPITPSVVLSNQCAPDHQYTVYINGVMTNTVSTAGTYEVSIRYTPTVNGLAGSAPATTNPFFNKELCWQNITFEDKTGPTCNLAQADLEYNFVCGFVGATANPTFSDCSGTVTANAVIETVIGSCGDIVGLTDGDNNLYNDLMATGSITFMGMSIPAPSEAEAGLLNGASYELESIIKRTYSASDGTNTGTACEQFIYIWRPTIILPPNTVALTCNSSTTPTAIAGFDPQLVPHFANPLFIPGNNTDPANDFMGTNIADPTFTSTLVDDNGNAQFVALVGGVGHGVCNFTTTFTDDPTVVSCGNTIKFIRRYSVLDCCDAAILMNDASQLISTVDNVAPVFTDCPTGTATGTITNPRRVEITSSNSCIVSLDFNTIRPTATDVCSEPLVYGVSYFVLASDFSGAGTFVTSGLNPTLEKGNYRADVTATDDCGNISAVCSVYLQVDDAVVPTVICKEISVSVDGNGNATICADKFASAHDNCGTITNLQVRKMVDPDNTFADCITISCTDATVDANGDQVVNLVYRAIDACGNSNINMCPAKIEIKTPPSFTCPADVDVECSDFDSNSTTVATCIQTITLVDNIPPVFDPITSPLNVECDNIPAGPGVTATDACSTATVTFDDVIQAGTCADEMTITRTLTATDVCGNAETAVQVINVSDNMAPTISNVPVDITINCNDNLPTTLPTAADNCDNDVTITFADGMPMQIGTCPNESTIVRTFTATDNCGNASTATQTISLDNVTPTVTAAPNQSIDCMMMEGFTFTPPTVVDSPCGSTNVVTTGPATSTNTLANGDIEMTRTYTVTDDCGFNQTVSTTITFTNCCPTLDVDITNFESECTNGVGTITAIFTSTIPVSQVVLRMIRSSDGAVIATQPGTNPIFSINQAPGAVDGYTVQAFTLGNEPMGDCPIESVFEAFGCSNQRIAGRVFNEEFISIEDVEVELMNTEIPMIMTDIDGEYTFEDLENQEYTVAAHKENDPANGISTFDLVVMAQHVLGINPLSTPYKLIAADVNMDEEIDILDLIELRELILYTIQDFTVNESWRFIDAEYEFPDPRNPWLETIPSSHTMDLGTEDAVVDFIAVKIGDLDCSAQTKSNFNSLEERSNKKMVLNALNQTVKAGTSFDVVLNPSSDITLSSAQFTLHFDASMADFSGITSESLELKNSFSEMYMEEGLVPFAWYTHKAKDLDVDTDLVFTFTAKQDLSVSELFTIDSELTPALAYTPNGTQYDVQLNILDTNVDANHSIVLHQNKPNPFSDASIIGFELPNEQAVSITIFDIDGKLLYTKDVEGTAGYNRVELTADEISKTGVLFYQLNTGDYSVTKKMIILE